MALSASKDYQIYAETILSIATNAAAEIKGVEILSADSKTKKANKRDVQVYFIGENKVSIDLFVNVKSGFTVPEVASALQERVKSEVENATRFKVSAVNVKVVSVILED